MEINYLLSSAQVKSLLVGMGYRRTVGLKIDDAIVDDQMMISSLNQLTNEGLINSDGENFSLQNDLRDIINQLGNATCFMGIRSKKKSLPDLCVFPGNKLLLCEQEKSSGVNFKFGFCSRNNLFKRFCEEGYFPEFENCGSIDEDELEVFENEYLNLCDDLDPICEDSRESLFLFYTHLNENRRCFKVINYFMYRYILLSDGEKNLRYLFTRENVEMLLLKFLEDFK